MPRICFFGGNISRSGGTERVTSLIANELVKKGYEITILSISEGKKGFYELDERICLASLYDKHVIGLFRFPQITFKLRNYIIKNKIDVLVDVDIILSLNSVLALWKTNVKLISWEHFNYFSTLGKKRRVWGRKLAAKYANHIITLTKEDMGYYLDNLNVKANIDYIYNPNPYPDRGHSNCNSKIAISVGRLTPIKGFDKLLDIWSEVEKKDKEWKLYIIGSGEDKRKLYRKKEKLKLERLVFIDHTKEIEKYYKMASIYLMTSRFEGLPMTLIEAQSFGLPIISYDIKTGPRDIVTDNKDGYLIKNDNKIKFVEKFVLLSSSKERIKIFSKEAAKSSKRFDIEKIVDKWESVITGE
jgi:glycosyltransferase involved in cell wall biosynthesis